MTAPHDTSRATAPAATPRDTWMDACGADELEPGGRRVVRTPAGARVAIFRLPDGAVRAVDDVCPHEGYPLSRGEVAGETLTCCWHNFQFDMRSGACLKGDEAVTVFPARIRGERVQIDVAGPDPAAATARRWASLAEGVAEGRLGQVARNLERLAVDGATPTELLGWIARYDARHAEWGSTHVLPLATDLLDWTPRHGPEDAALCVAIPFELAAESHVRRPARPRPAPTDPGGDPEAAGERLRALVEGRDADGAEALLRGAVAAGWGPDVLEPWLYRITCDHFLDIGHHLIYQVRAFELLAAVGWDAADDILSGHLLGMVHGTRHDTLPEWRWVQTRLDALAPRLPELLARGLGGRRDDAAREAIAQAIAGPDRDAALDAPFAALRDGLALDTVLEALVLAAAERVIRFDVAHDDDVTLNDGWLDITHGYTYASALRQAAARFKEPALLRHVAFAARTLHALSALDADAPAPASPPEGARAEVEARILRHPSARPIVLAHIVKLARAAWIESEATRDPRPLAALGRLLEAPVRQRPLPRLVHEARRLVRDGKVPRSRL